MPACNQSILDKPYFYDEAAAFSHLEGIMWPNGAVCPHCSAKDRIYELKGKSTRVGLKKCGNCRKQFTVKIGTVFESSHVPLHKWLQAFYLMTSGKENISIHKLHQVLEVTYKTAWHMNERLSDVMRESIEEICKKIAMLDLNYESNREEILELESIVFDFIHAIRSWEEY
ncbi:transposase [Aquimarina macrocephali]|uniref:transposase n=1 Tax=Aquimarina macrocephali TaxID=666563 RepID=UPI000464594B|nr:transposase [Aquimarina macrocephali]